MIYERHSVGKPLNRFVECIFHYRDFIPEHKIEKVIPTGNVYLLFELDGIKRRTFDSELNPIGHFHDCWISGMHRKHLNISAHQHSEMLVVQFKPSGAYPFLKTPVKELNDIVQQGEAYFGSSILRLRKQIMEKERIFEKFALVDRWLLDVFDERKAPPAEIEDVVAKLQNQPFVKHNELLRDYPKTRKHLIGQFNKFCGLTPKVLHRIFRFNTLLTKINRKEEIVWTDILYETGYADQSHFIKEFQEFSGFNPSIYIRKGYNESFPNFLPIDKPG